MNPVIAPQMAGLIEGTRRELDTREAEARAAKAKRYVRAESQLKERIERLHERLQETQKRFSPHARPHLRGGQDWPGSGKEAAAQACRVARRAERDRVRDAGAHRLVGALHGRPAPSSHRQDCVRSPSIIMSPKVATMWSSFTSIIAWCKCACA